MDPTELLSLAKSARRRPLWIPSDRTARVSIGQEGIERLIPHRDPFLLLDAITEVDLSDRAIRGRRRIDPDDPVLRGHFPGRPIYPGVLQLESIGQLGLCLIQFLAAGDVEISAAMRPRDARAVKVHAAQFYDAVRPDEDLTLVCQVLALDEYTATCAGQMVRDETVCSFGVMEVYFVDG